MRRWWFWFAFATAVAWLLLWAPGEASLQRARLDNVPADLRPTGIEYAQAAEIAFGPGGDEYALYIYPLSERVADDIVRDGRDFFYRQDNVDMRIDRDQQKFADWFPTPILRSSFRPYDPPDRTLAPIRMRDLNYGGEGVFPFPPDVAGLVDSMLAEQGNFYSRNWAHSSTVIVVSPARRKIIYFHKRGL